jgi:hypothetical protein
MPDLDVVVMGFCPQYRSNFHVTGSKGDTYFVSMDGGDFLPTCSCKAYTFSAKDACDKTCKHIALVREHGCFYSEQGCDPGPNDLEAHGVTLRGIPHTTLDRKCLGCGQNMIPVKVAV